MKYYFALLVWVFQINAAFCNCAQEIAKFYQSTELIHLEPRAQKFAETQLPVLILGETGTGKTRFAEWLHTLSKRPGLFLPVNVTALNSNIIESELFGHTKGSFTSAIASTEGLFKAADKGTLFLDEIGDLPLEVQAKLLRVIEAKKIRRVGDTKEIDVDVRIITATHADLRQRVEAGKFREDLFYRLDVLNIKLSPLKEWKTETLDLAKHILKVKAAERNFTLSPEAEVKILRHTWPGNIRELENVLMRATLLAESDKLNASDLEIRKIDDEIVQKERIEDELNQRIEAKPSPYVFYSTSLFYQKEAEMRKRLLHQALTLTKGNKTEAATLLEISRPTLMRWVVQFNFQSKNYFDSIETFEQPLETFEFEKIKLQTDLLLWAHLKVGRNNKSQIAVLLGLPRQTIDNWISELNILELK